MKSKHSIIRSISSRLKEDAGKELVPAVAVYQAVTISNDLYRPSTMSASELAKGFTKPVNSTPDNTATPQKVMNASHKIQARSKSALIVRSKTASEVPVSIEDTVESFQKKDLKKPEKLIESKTVLSIVLSARSVVVSGTNVQTNTAASEDTRWTISLTSLAQLVRDGVGSLEECIPSLFHITDDYSLSQAENDKAAHLEDQEYFFDDLNHGPAEGDQIDIL